MLYKMFEIVFRVVECAHDEVFSLEYAFFVTPLLPSLLPQERKGGTEVNILRLKSEVFVWHAWHWPRNLCVAYKPSSCLANSKFGLKYIYTHCTATFVAIVHNIQTHIPFQCSLTNLPTHRNQFWNILVFIWTPFSSHLFHMHMKLQAMLVDLITIKQDTEHHVGPVAIGSWYVSQVICFYVSEFSWFRQFCAYLHQNSESNIELRFINVRSRLNIAILMR